MMMRRAGERPGRGGPGVTMSRRELERLGFVIDNGVVRRALDATSGEGAAAERAVTRARSARPARPARPRGLRRTLRVDEVVLEREGDTLRGTIPSPPRTKKNGTTLGIRQSPAYRQFCADVVEACAAHLRRLGLPLPDRPYNCAAHFRYADAEPDTVGLFQGLADAFERAGILTNDRFIVTWNGSSPPVRDRERPRVEFILTPMPRDDARAAHREVAGSEHDARCASGTHAPRAPKARSVARTR